MCGIGGLSNLDKRCNHHMEVIREKDAFYSVVYLKTNKFQIPSHLNANYHLIQPVLFRLDRNRTLQSPIHTARWSRKMARKLPECLLCERKHVPGLIPGSIPGWDLVTLPGSVPERALCEQKPDQCRKGCVVVMTHFIVRQFYWLF